MRPLNAFPPPARGTVSFVDEIEKIKDGVCISSHTYQELTATLHDPFAQHMHALVDKLVLIESQKAWGDETKLQLQLNGITGPVTHSLRTLTPLFSYLFQQAVNSLFDQRRLLSITATNAPHLHDTIHTAAAQLLLHPPTIVINCDTHSYGLHAYAIEPKNILVVIDEGLLHLLDAREVKALCLRELFRVKKGNVLIKKILHWTITATSLTLIYKWITQFVRRGELFIPRAIPWWTLVSTIGVLAATYAIVSHVTEKTLSKETALTTRQPKRIAAALKKIYEKKCEFEQEYNLVLKEIDGKLKPLCPIKGEILKFQVSLLKALKRAML